MLFVAALLASLAASGDDALPQPEVAPVPPMRVCPAGKYVKVHATTSSDRTCATCPRGHKCDGSVRVRCRGFAPQVVSGDYIPMFQDEAGKAQCKKCAECPDGAVRKNCHRASPGYCEPCPGGYTKATRFACTPCPAGTYAPNSMTCLPCQPGRFAQKGAALCSSCAPGTYTHLQKQHSCMACDGWSHGTGPGMASHPRAGGTVCSAHTVCKAKQWETKPLCVSGSLAYVFLVVACALLASSTAIGRLTSTGTNFSLTRNLAAICV